VRAAVMRNENSMFVRILELRELHGIAKVNV
jgi:hypothetical protein